MTAAGVAVPAATGCSIPASINCSSRFSSEEVIVASGNRTVMPGVVIRTPLRLRPVPPSSAPAGTVLREQEEARSRVAVAAAAMDRMKSIFFIRQKLYQTPYDYNVQVTDIYFTCLMFLRYVDAR
jgi:hypothetical protein